MKFCNVGLLLFPNNVDKGLMWFSHILIPACFHSSSILFPKIDPAHQNTIATVIATPYSNC